MSEELYKDRLALVTLASLADDVRALDPVDIASRMAPGFLVCPADSPLVIPDGPVETQRVDVRLLKAAQERNALPTSPVFLLVRKPGSVYRFISAGRTRNCDITIPDESVSKLHALLREEGGALYIEDAGSRNGTFVDGARAPRRGEGDALPLSQGARVRLGHVETTFYTPEALRALVVDVLGPG